jgi:multidrug efflux pump subunit AcrB
MNPIVFALRHPYTILVAVLAVVCGSVLAFSRLRVDIFPNLNQPVIYVCQPYGGMTPQQMEGLLTNYYEFHFLYVNGIEHVESKNIQGMTLIGLHFHPGTDMSQAMAEVVASVNRSRFMMPPGTVPPFVVRHDVGSASVGYLVLSSETKSIKDIQDIATLRVRPAFASIDGISTPPAFGGNQRAIVVSVRPDALHRHQLTLEQVTEAVTAGNVVAPSGNVRIDDRNFVVTTNAMVGDQPKKELGDIAVKPGPVPVYLKDVADVDDSSDITAGYVLVDGRRSVYMLVTKRSNASTLSVVNALRKKLPELKSTADPNGEIDIRFAFDQSPIVTEAMWGVGIEGLIGAGLTGLMVLLFLRDWRSVVVVVLNIPFALLAGVVALWLTGQTLNLMTLGGLALAVGILVDEATVEVENIHAQMHDTPSVALAVRRGNQETAVPRLLAMLCILVVFVPSFFMEGAARELFVPLSLAVGFAMIASYLLSSTFVPVASVWLMKRVQHTDDAGLFGRLKGVYTAVVRGIVRVRWLIVPGYLAGAGFVLWFLFGQLGTAIFPPSDKGQFRFRMKAPTGSRIERTEELTREAVRIIEAEAGAGNVATTVGYVGQFPTNYPVQATHQWTSGPDEALMLVSFRPNSGVRIEEFKNRLREVLPVKLGDWLRQRWSADGVPSAEIEKRVGGLALSFEPGDLISEVMSFGSPTAVEVQVSGNDMKATRPHAEKILAALQKLPELKDVQLTQSQEYPTVEVTLDRVKIGQMGLTTRSISNALIPATASSRYMNPIYWRDPKSGQAYIVQVQIPPPQMNTAADLGNVPVRIGHGNDGTGVSPGVMSSVLLRDVVKDQDGVKATTTPGRVDRYNMRRMLSVTANVATDDLGRVGRVVRKTLAEIGDPPTSVRVDVRGQLVTLATIQGSLFRGLAVAVLAIALLLTAYYQSIRLTLVTVAALPATVCGSAAVLYLTGTTLNLQSFMGAIMSLGVSVANAILLVTFAERSRTDADSAATAAVRGGSLRLRAILMTSSAMIAGMLPMAMGWAEGGEQAKPLGRAVVGGLLASTVATLFILPAVFAVVMGRSGTGSASLDPDDPASRHFTAKTT